MVRGGAMTFNCGQFVEYKVWA